MPCIKSTALIIPTYNAASHIDALLQGILQQELQPNHILVIDSGSTDNTIELLKKHPVTVHQIPKAQFNHGGTRQQGIKMVDADIYIFMTQDAKLANKEALTQLLLPLQTDASIGCAYGRQLPNANANPLARHARLFNYPPQSQTKALKDRKTLGIKTCFISNSFTAYRKSALLQIGGFPTNLNFGEDSFVAAKMLLANWRIAYAADACVYHSHNLSLMEEFNRYRAIGKFHRQNKWLLEEFAAPTKEGMRLVKSELNYLLCHKHYGYLLKALAHTAAKFIGYRLGYTLRD